MYRCVRIIVHLLVGVSIARMEFSDYNIACMSILVRSRCQGVRSNLLVYVRYLFAGALHLATQRWPRTAVKSVTFDPRTFSKIYIDRIQTDHLCITKSDSSI